MPGGGRAAGPWDHPPGPTGRLRGPGARDAPALGWGAVRRAALARAGGPSRSSRQLPVRAVLSAIDDLPTRDASGGPWRSESHQALPSG